MHTAARQPANERCTPALARRQTGTQIDTDIQTGEVRWVGLGRCPHLPAIA